VLLAACSGRVGSGGESAGTEATGEDAAEDDDDADADGDGDGDADADGDGDGDGDGALPVQCDTGDDAWVEDGFFGPDPGHVADVDVAPSGAIGLVGGGVEGHDGDGFVHVLCPDGSEAWHDETTGAYSWVQSIRFAADGDVWVSGDVSNDVTYDRFVARYDRDGGRRWFRVYPGPGGDDDESGGIWESANRLAHRDGHVYVTGTVDDPVQQNQVWLAEMGEDGDFLWEYTGGDPEAFESAFALDVDDEIIVAGGHVGAPEGPGDAFMQAFTRDGTPLWWQRFYRPAPGGGTYAAMWDLAIRGDLIVGAGDVAYGGWVIAVDRDDGDLVWEDTFDDPGAEQFDHAMGIVVDDLGRLVVIGTGWDWDQGGRYVPMRLYSDLGDLLDSRSYRYAEHETLGGDVARGPDGHLFVGAFDRDGFMLAVESVW
jgi:hypothetical protein